MEAVPLTFLPWSPSMRILLCLLAAVSLAGILGCARPDDPDAARNALLEADRAWADAAASGDVERIASFWTEDAVDYFPGAPVAAGKSNILELVKRNRSQEGFALSWEPTEGVVARSGELGYTVGRFQLSMADIDGSPMMRTGHYLCIWKRQPDGSWKCSVETSVFGPPAGG